MYGVRTMSWSIPVGVAAAIFAAATALFAPAAIPARAEDVEAAYLAAPLERDLGRMLSERSETASFIFHYRPKSQAEKAQAEVAKKLEDLHNRLRARLDLKTRQKLHVFLYDSAPELAHLTGRQATEALAIGGALHMALDRDSAAAGLARLLEPLYGRAGDKVGGGLEAGRTYKLRVLCRGGILEAFLDGKKFLETEKIETQPGAITLGIEAGRVTIRDLRLREAPPSPKTEPSTPWTYALREGAEAPWVPELEGVWSVSGGSIEGTRYGRFSRTRLGGATLEHLELECAIRLADGALAEIGLHVTPEKSTRLVFLNHVIWLQTGADRPRKATVFATGPRWALRDGFAEALAGEIAGAPIHPEARALVEKNLLPPLDRLLRESVPAFGAQRTRRLVALRSFVAFCLEKFGTARYRELHFDDLAGAKTPLGTFAELEEQWKAHLRTAPRTDEQARKADRDLGLDVLVPASAWRDLMPAARERKFKTLKGSGGRWEAGPDGLGWEGEPGLSPGRLEAPLAAPARSAFAATVRFGEASRLRIEIAARDGKESAALVGASGAALVTPDNTVAAKANDVLDPLRWYDVALVLDGGGAARVYVDGRLAAEARGLASGPGAWQLEAEGRRVEVRGLAARALK